MSEEEGYPNPPSTKTWAPTPEVELKALPIAMKAPPPSCPVIQATPATKPPHQNLKRTGSSRNFERSIADVEDPDTRSKCEELLAMARLAIKKEVEPTPEGGLRIGALVRNTDLAAHPRVRRDYAVLSRALLAGASATHAPAGVATAAGGSASPPCRTAKVGGPSTRERLPSALN